LIYQHATEERDRAVADYLDQQASEAVAEAAAGGSGGTVTPIRRG
jgi:hypothetical protein